MFIARAPFISGAERALLSTLRYLDRDRVEPYVVLGERTAMTDILESMDIPHAVMAMPKRSRGSLFGWWRSVSQLTALARRFGADVMHANDVPSCQALSVVGEQCHIPRVVHVRWGITAPAAGWWARRGAEAVICISHWVGKQLGDMHDTALAGAHLQEIPDAVDWPAKADAAAPRPSLLEEGLGETRIGFAGQLIEDKGLDLVIEAMGKMDPEDRPRLLVAGEDTQTQGVYRQRLENLARRCGVADRITWLGFLDHVEHLYAKVHAMVCPSRVEPLGLVPLEAAQYGIPTFASRESGFLETIEHNVTGVLVKTEVDAWAKALKQVQIHAWLKELGVEAHRRTREQFSPMLYQQRLMAIYQQVVNNPTAGAEHT